MLAYGVATKVLNQAVERNAERLPEDFVFRLERPELEALNRSQAVAGSRKYRDPRFRPFAFTEHGAIQAANVLNSPRAVEMDVHVVRAFVQLRELLASNQELARRLDQLEARIEKKLFDVENPAALLGPHLIPLTILRHLGAFLRYVPRANAAKSGIWRSATSK